MSEQWLFYKKSRCERYVVRSDVVRVTGFEPDTDIFSSNFKHLYVLDFRQFFCFIPPFHMIYFLIPSY